jgi:hypothetical protein
MIGALIVFVSVGACLALLFLALWQALQMAVSYMAMNGLSNGYFERGVFFLILAAIVLVFGMVGFQLFG